MNLCRCCKQPIKTDNPKKRSAKWCPDNPKCQEHKTEWIKAYQRKVQRERRSISRGGMKKRRQAALKGKGTKICVKCEGEYEGPNARRCPSCVEYMSRYHAGVQWEGV